MQASAEVLSKAKQQARNAWFESANAAAAYAEELLSYDIHKQIVNRVLEPYMWAHTIVTSTEWDNFFNLRISDDAQPEIQQLAICMKEAMDKSTPKETMHHLPYITYEEMLDSMDKDNNDNLYRYFAHISAARCARVSYLNHDQSQPDINRDIALANKLLEAKHLSPFENQAFALPDPNQPSNNFVGWLQYRATL